MLVQQDPCDAESTCLKVNGAAGAELGLLYTERIAPKLGPVDGADNFRRGG